MVTFVAVVSMALSGDICSSVSVALSGDICNSVRQWHSVVTFVAVCVSGTQW